MARIPFTLESLVAEGQPKPSEEKTLIDGCFRSFASNNESLSQTDFGQFLQQLFHDPKSRKPHDVPAEKSHMLFDKFDTNGDGRIDVDEFSKMWEKWVKVILWPRSALLVVDVQNDFISGSLALYKCSAKHNGEDVIPVINKLQEEVPFHDIFYSMDWHPPDHVSFLANAQKRRIIAVNDKAIGSVNSTIDESVGWDKALNLKEFDTVTYAGPPTMVQKMWPTHCVQNTYGAAIHSDLQVKPGARIIYKGDNPLVDSYSVFWDNAKLRKTDLHDQLLARSITDLYICGIATDVCVTYTALDAIECGYRTIMIEDGCRGVDEKDIARSKLKLMEKNCVIVKSSAVKEMVLARDRRPELGYALASTLK